MEITAALAADLAILTQALDEPDADIAANDGANWLMPATPDTKRRQRSWPAWQLSIRMRPRTADGVVASRRPTVSRT